MRHMAQPFWQKCFFHAGVLPLNLLQFPHHWSYWIYICLTPASFPPFCLLIREPFQTSVMSLFWIYCYLFISSHCSWNWIKHRSLFFKLVTKWNEGVVDSLAYKTYPIAHIPSRKTVILESQACLNLFLAILVKLNSVEPSCSYELLLTRASIYQPLKTPSLDRQRRT